MDKRKYKSKTLIAEFSFQRKIEEWYDEDSKFSESIYRLKDGSLILEYDGERFSTYGIAISFNKFIARKGIIKLDSADYRIWRILRNNNKNGVFIDWEDQYNSQLFMDHETKLKCTGNNELPF